MGSKPIKPNGECRFCDDYWSFKEENKVREKITKGTKISLTHRYKACLVEEIYKNGISAGKITWRPRNLYYCPTCGRELRGLKKRPEVIKND